MYLEDEDLGVRYCVLDGIVGSDLSHHGRLRSAPMLPVLVHLFVNGRASNQNSDMALHVRRSICLAHQICVGLAVP